MPFFSSARTFLGLDISTSTLKLVELVERKKQLEVATYAQAQIPNLLVRTDLEDDAVIKTTASVISRMMERSRVVADFVVAALPSNVVFSTVLMLPSLPFSEMEKAVRFAARDVIPLDIDDMVLGWSRVGENHSDMMKEMGKTVPVDQTEVRTQQKPQGTTPIFVTAAPQEIVQRYVKLSQALHLNLYALELDVFPLIRSLLSRQDTSALIIDIGAVTTTFHVVDRGTPRITHTIDYGGHNITQILAKELALSESEAENMKMQYGLDQTAAPTAYPSLERAVMTIGDQAKNIVSVYTKDTGLAVDRVILIGGGALLRGISEYLSGFLQNTVVIGNPWRGLAYPQPLGSRFEFLGPQFAVAVGLALRGFGGEVS